MENDNGLPEIYLSPTKSTAIPEDEANWENAVINFPSYLKFKPNAQSLSNAAVAAINDIDSNHGVVHPSCIKRQKGDTLSTKGKRGKTPGSDSKGGLNLLNKVKSVGKEKVLVSKVQEYNSDSDNSCSSVANADNNKHFNQRRAVEGADDVGKHQPFASTQQICIPVAVAKVTLRNTPPGISTPENTPPGRGTPEILSFTSNSDKEAIISSEEPISHSIRPPALGQSKETMHYFSRKDLGSTDGEDSNNDSITQVLKVSTSKNLLETCSIGSQSENTDSASTVLDMKREPVLGCEKDLKAKVWIPESCTLSKPNFIVGGATYPLMGPKTQNCLLGLGNQISGMNDKIDCETLSKQLQSLQMDVMELEDSLTSLISVDSTHLPESSECITSPSVISVSSAASSKKLEWDSGADVGYTGKAPQHGLTSSLSTLERIAIGNYASVLRSEPEGTTNLKAKSNKKTHRESKTSRPFRTKASSSIRNSEDMLQSSNYEENFCSLNHPRQYSSSGEDCVVDTAGTSVVPRRKSKKVIGDGDGKSFSIAKSKCKSSSLGNIDDYESKNLVYNVNSLSRLNSVKKRDTKVSSPLKKRNNYDQRDQTQSIQNFNYEKINKSANVSTSSSTLIDGVLANTFSNESSLNRGLVFHENVSSQPLENLHSWDTKVKTLPYDIKLDVELRDYFDGSLIIDAREIKENEKSYDCKGSCCIDEVLKSSKTKSDDISNEFSTLNNRPSSEKDFSDIEKVSYHSTEFSGSDSVESSISVNTINCALLTLSKKLKRDIDNMVNMGSFGKFDDYNKLQDYIEFVGIPSSNEDEIKLKQSIADIIIRMFADMNSPDMDNLSLTLNKADELTQVALSSHSSSTASSTVGNKSLITKADDNSDKGSEFDSRIDIGEIVSETKDTPIEAKESLHLREKLVHVPYRPPNSSRTYLMVSSEADSQTSDSQNDEVLKKVPVVSSNKGIYQDKKGAFHLAQQPPGYNSCIDSHFSASTSENENKHNNKAQCAQLPNEVSNNNLLERPYRPQILSSTGSESAYETIRERHRNVGDSLASSFEFYSTSPRDARHLGYDANDVELDEADLDEHRDLGALQNQSTLSGASKHSKSSSLDSDYRVGSKSSEKALNMKSSENEFSSFASHKQAHFPRKSTKKQLKKSVNHSTQGESEGASSSLSFVQVERKNYIKRIRQYIHTLEKLERTLVPSFGSLDSNNGEEHIRNKKELKGRLFPDPKYSFDKGSDSVDLSSGQNYESSVSNCSKNTIDNSMIIHSNLSFPKEHLPLDVNYKGINNISSLSNSLLSEDASVDRSCPRQTSTLRKEEKIREKKKYSKHKIVDNSHIVLPEIWNFGNCPDYRKLLASNDIPGEIRPHRLILQDAKVRYRKKRNKNDYSFSHAAVSEKLNQNFTATDNGKFKSYDNEIIISNVSDGVNSVNSSACSKSIEDYAFQDSCKLVSEDSHPHITTVTCNFDASTNKNRKNENHKKLTSSLSSNENSLTKSLASEVSSKSRNNVRTNSSGRKLMVEFGQMFPSTSNLALNDTNEKVSLIDHSEKMPQRSAVSTQTGNSFVACESLVSPDCEDGKAKTLQSFCPTLIRPNNDNIDKDIADIEQGHENKKINFKDISSTLNSVQNAVSHDSLSTLEVMKAKIDDNALKINSALEAYNKQFPTSVKPSRSHKLSAPPRSLNTEIDRIIHDSPDVSDTSKVITHNLQKEKNILDTRKENNFIKPSKHVDKIRSTNCEDNLKFFVNIDDHSLKNKSASKTSLVDELIELNKENEIMTLQEALSLAKPKYLKEAERRRTKICRKHAVRQEIQKQNQSVLASLPENLKTPSVLQKFLFKSEESPLFTYKSMREQNNRLYQLLPESQFPKIRQKKTGMIATNRLMASYYSQKLRRKALSGKLSHAHRDVITPTR